MMVFPWIFHRFHKVFNYRLRFTLWSRRSEWSRRCLRRSSPWSLRWKSLGRKSSARLRPPNRRPGA